MAGIDSSIYFQQQPLDILGNVQKGMNMGHQIQDRQRQQQELAQQAELQKVYQSAIVKNPDGSVSFDQNRALQMLAGAPGGGKAAYEMSQNIYNQNLAATKYADAQKQQGIENDFARQRLLNDKENRAESKAQRDFLTNQAREEKMQGLQTPYGIANTVDDAKQLKEGHLSKQAFDNKLQQMIDLRTKHEGGALFNRDDVARGKQLSKDLLLEYKNMAKLGVLSKSDEDIINAIIPEDPLQYNSPLAAIQGQDPTLTRLKAFKEDSNKNFNDAISVRTRAGMLNMKPSDLMPGKKPSWAL